MENLDIQKAVAADHSSSEGIIIPPTDGPALDEAFRQEDAATDKILESLDKPHPTRFIWTGKDILGNTYSGAGNTSAECYAASALSGAVNCFPEQNPDFIEPEALALEPEEKPLSAFTANDFYSKGYADGDAAYQDIKTLILAWVSEQMLSSNPGFAQEVESIPFVVYARFNR